MITTKENMAAMIKINQDMIKKQLKHSRSKGNNKKIK